MPFPDLTMALLFVLFLAAFVLIGIYPAFKRAAAKLRALQQASDRAKPPIARKGAAQDALFARTPAAGPLNDFEIIVLRRLARAGKALSRRQVNAPLLFGPKTLRAALRSLGRRGLVHVTPSPLGTPRYALTGAGLRLALEQGYLLTFREGARRGAGPGSVSPSA